MPRTKSIKDGAVKTKSKVYEWLKGEKLEKLKQWYSEGLNESQVASLIGVSRKTLYAWRNDNEEFADIVEQAKSKADIKIVNAVYLRAQGYNYTEKKSRLNADTGQMEVVEEYERHLPADIGAAKFWLENRNPNEWRAKVEPTDEEDHTLTIIFKDPEGEDYGM